MDEPIPPEAICVTCRCGKQAIVEPRFFNKLQGCAGCQREFMIVLVREGEDWEPKLMFADDGGPDQSSHPPPAATMGPWFNVTCACGRKIGVDRRLAGRLTRCSICGQEILIALQTSPDGQDLTKILKGAKASDTPAPMLRPPTEMHLLCMCGETLLITPQFYNAPIRCGECGTRLSLHMRFDEKRKRYELDASVLPE